MLIPHDVVVREPADGAGGAEDAEAGTGADPALAERSVRAARPVPASRPPAPAADRTDGNGPAPLPRRVPQTSLVAELRDEDPGTGRDDAPDDDAEFTAERAAASLAGFQRGTLRAQADDADADAENILSPAAPSTTPDAEHRTPTKDTR